MPSIMLYPILGGSMTVRSATPGSSVWPNLYERAKVLREWQERTIPSIILGLTVKSSITRFSMLEVLVGRG